MMGDDYSFDTNGYIKISTNLARNGQALYGSGVGGATDYVLSDVSVIPNPPKMKRLPQFGTKIKLDTKFIETFIKGKSALTDVDTFTVLNNTKMNRVEVVIGYASINTNRVTIPVTTTASDLNEPLQLGTLGPGGRYDCWDFNFK